LAFSGQIC